MHVHYRKISGGNDKQKEEEIIMILLPCHAFQNFFPFFQNMESCKKTSQIFYSNAHVLLECTAADQRRWFLYPSSNPPVEHNF